MTVDVNYRNKKRYKTARYPLYQGIFWTGRIWLLSIIALIGKDYKVEKVNMEGVIAPYMLLSNHMHFIDFELAAIATRKFTTNLHLVKSIRHVLKRGDILAMYPEARYTPCGTTAFLPDSLGKLIKMNKVPVVAVVHHGNHLYVPSGIFGRSGKFPCTPCLPKS